MKVLLNNKEINPLSLSISKKLSAPSVCNVQFALDDVDVDIIKNQTNTLAVEDKTTIFIGTDLQITSDTINVNKVKNTIEITFFDDVCKLETDFLPVSIELTNENIIDFLNSNSKKVRFQNYNLRDDQKIISINLSKMSFSSILRDFQDELDFDYWYENGFYFLGKPDQETILDVELPASYEIDKRVINKVVVSTGENKSSLEFVNKTTTYPIFKDTYKGQDYYYIQDYDSILKYGERVKFVDGTTYKDEDQKERFSLYTYQEATSILDQNSKPKIVIRDLKYYQQEQNLSFNNTIRLNGFDKLFKIADVSIDYTRDTEEGYYNVTLVNQLDNQSKSNYLIKKFEKQLRV